MNRVVLASHGGLAKGMRDTLDMIVGDASRIYAETLQRDDTDQIDERILGLIDTFDEGDKVYLLTDMLGSSVNNQVVSLLAKRPGLTIISGMNLPLVLELALSEEALSDEALQAVIEQSRTGIQDVSLLMKAAMFEEDDDL